jgi:hypothetical protein
MTTGVYSPAEKDSDDIRKPIILQRRTVTTPETHNTADKDSERHQELTAQSVMTPRTHSLDSDDIRNSTFCRSTVMPPGTHNSTEKDSDRHQELIAQTVTTSGTYHSAEDSDDTRNS